MLRSRRPALYHLRPVHVGTFHFPYLHNLAIYIPNKALPLFLFLFMSENKITVLNQGQNNIACDEESILNNFNREQDYCTYTVLQQGGHKEGAMDTRRG
ncbi:hypothetical protein SADUNF_Sadunf19G0042300 [Salix dunnii]|uniref:Uncharacterized protein n=1 Tax=Salix dunnii TaxID=1413687 RepID=A0A835MHL5_9ROSI|nr:hypothetical protein SADUNF_Sadunf19G0042300 [Salix dunnii]